MVKQFIYNILKARHFWRYASFSEIAELYISRTMRVIAMNIVAGFTSVYLYEEGYSLTFIMSFWMCYYIFRMVLAFLSARIVAHFGPKHAILFSNLIYVPALMFLGLMGEFGIVSIILWGVFMAISTSLYASGFMVDLSKVKNAEHAGKELAFMNILDKVAVGISPILGGLIAMWFGLPVVIWLAAILFAMSAIPLLKTIEPTMLRQKIDINGFPWRTAIRCYIANIGIGVDLITTGVAWNLFIVIVVFPTVGWDVYVKLGALSSVTIVAAIFASYAYGKIIDRKQGGSLLKISVVANALVHLSRPFTANASSIVMTNVTNEVATMGYSMAFTRGVLDTADLSGHRIVFLCLNDIASDIGASIACGLLVVLCSLLGDADGLRIFFTVSACTVLLIGTANFRLYRK